MNLQLTPSLTSSAHPSNELKQTETAVSIVPLSKIGNIRNVAEVYKSLKL